MVSTHKSHPLPNHSLLKKYGFHEWLCKTNFSFLIGASHPFDMLRSAQLLGYESLCINDYDGVYGLARSYREQQRLVKDSSIKLNYGAEIHLSQDHHFPLLLQDTIVLVAKDWQGYKNLCCLLTYAHRNGKDMAYIPPAYLLTQDIAGLFAIVPMRGLIRSQQTHPFYAQLLEHFKGQLYFAISRHFHPSEDQWIQPTLELANYLGANCLLSQDVFFHHRCEKSLSDLLHAIRTNKVLAQCKEHFFPNGERSFHRLVNIERFFSSLPIYESALKLSYELNQECQFSLSQLRYHYPQEMVPDAYQGRAHAYLESLTWQGAREIFGQQLPEKIAQTLNNELNLIEQLNFADYFLTVWDIVHWARSQDILCQGRGSAANSAVCFVLGITAVDPTLFDLLFERFISMERGDPPDIDVDFEHERREEVIQYIYRRYGRDRAAMVANVITYRKKGAIRAVGKALGIDENSITRVSKLSRSKHFRRQTTETLFSAIKQEIPLNISWTLWQQLSDKLMGFPRHMGIHSGGFMLSDKPLNYLLAQEPATMEGRSVIQWCKEDIEALGFFKIDVLALGMLTAVRKCFDYIAHKYAKKLTMYSIPADDPATYSMIQRAETVGTFQIESRAQMSMLPRLRPRCFYDLVIEVAIIRPGPIQGKVIHPFLARREGLEPVTFPDERLRPILARTLGVTIFQEQAMRIAIAVGDFSPGEANELRKNIGAWNIKDFARDVNPCLIKLKRGMEKNAISKDFIQQLLGQMSGFSEYGFPESHAVSFALIAYASSYLKCHYPVAFFCAILNSQPMGFYSPHVLLQTARREGIKVLPISINYSYWDCQMELISTNKPANTEGSPIYAIRMGLRLVNGLSKTGAEKLLQQRQKQGGWKNFDDFLQNGNIYRDDFTALAAAQAFAEFDTQRADALWKAEAAPYRSAIDIQEAQLNWPAESTMTAIQKDFKAFNTSLEPHPVQVIKTEQWPYSIPLNKILESKQLLAVRRNSDVFVFGMVLAKQAPPSAKGMVFVTLEDEGGFINLALTPQVYGNYYNLVEGKAFLCVVGKLQRVNNYHSILVKRIFEAQALDNTISIQERKIRPIQSKDVPTKELLKPRFYI